MSRQLKAILNFKDNVESISDPDFGDFKRKFNNYLQRLSEALADNDKALAILRDLKAYVLYGNNLRTKGQVLFYVQYKVQNLMDLTRN